MQVSILNANVLTGQNATGSTSGLPIGPMGGDQTAPAEIQTSLANPGDGVLAEANEPLPPHIDTGGPPALAAPTPAAMPPSTGSTGEPQSLYATPVQK